MYHNSRVASNGVFDEAATEWCQKSSGKEYWLRPLATDGLQFGKEIIKQTYADAVEELLSDENVEPDENPRSHKLKLKDLSPTFLFPSEHKYIENCQGFSAYCKGCLGKEGVKRRMIEGLKSKQPRQANGNKLRKVSKGCSICKVNLCF